MSSQPEAINLGPLGNIVLSRRGTHWQCTFRDCTQSYTKSRVKNILEHVYGHAKLPVPAIFENVWCRYCAHSTNREANGRRGPKLMMEHQDRMHKVRATQTNWVGYEPRSAVLPCTDCHTAWPLRANVHDESCPKTNKTSPCHALRAWNESTLRYDYVNEILEELICTAEVKPAPPVSDGVEENRLGENMASRMNRAKDCVQVWFEREKEKEKEKLEHELKAIQLQKGNRPWSAAEQAQFEADIQEVKNKLNALEREHRAFLRRSSHSLSKSAHLLPSRHFRIYFPTTL